MRSASVGLITPDLRYDLNGNGLNADAGDYAMLQDAHKGGDCADIGVSVLVWDCWGYIIFKFEEHIINYN